MSVRSLRYSDLSLRLPKGTSALPIERDAWAFLDAAGITSALQQRAIVQLVRDLKKAQLWTKMKAVYPFVGGTATTHKWNLKDPQDTNAAFRLTFSGGWTHDANGVTGNGTNAYADTHLAPSTVLTINDHHAGVYVGSDTSGSTIKCEIGSYVTISYVRYLVIYSKFNNLTYMVSGDNVFPNFANSNAKGMYLLAKSTVTTLDGYKDATKKLTNSTTSDRGGSQSTSDVYIGAAKGDGTAVYYSDRRISYATIGQDLTDAEATLLYECVDRYQKTLGRAV